MATKTVTLDPKSLLGNIERSAAASGVTSKVPLNLGEALARVPAVTALPTPYAEGPFVTDPAKILVDQQANFDFKALQYVVDWEKDYPGHAIDARTLQGIANKSAVMFAYTLKGTPTPVVFTPGAYFPGE